MLRRSWISAVQVLIALAIAFALGTLGCALTDWWNANAQQIHIDTSTAQYKQQPLRVDSMATGPLVKWVVKLRLVGWKILLKADSLDAATAQTYISEPYRNALIVVDLRRLDPSMTEEVLLHEVLHIRLALYTAFVNILIGGHNGEGVGGPLLGEVQRNEEALVTDLSRALLWRPQ